MLAAETYYEQVYCEVVARGGGTGLPSMVDFRGNDETVQALILKRPAKRVGIDLPAPRRVVRQPPSAKPAEPPAAVLAARPPAAIARPTPGAASARRSIATPETAAPVNGCELAGAAIRCGPQLFALVGNLRNERLGDEALSEANRMGLPSFAAAAGDAAAVRGYLDRAYRRYVEKMMEIGLGGATMTYGKFAALFADLTDKGVDFAARFETMYGYLKQDKRRMGVNEGARLDAGMRISNCGHVSERIIACALGGRNYLFLRSSPG